MVYNKENMSGKEANMAEYVLENNILKVTVDSKGCEIPDRNSTVHNNAFFISLRSGVRFAKLTFFNEKKRKTCV